MMRWSLPISLLVHQRVRVTLDKDNDCWQLNSTDNAYVERHKERYSKYHNSTPKQQARHGEWQKDVRKDHDKQKSKVCVQLGIDV